MMNKFDKSINFLCVFVFLFGMLSGFLVTSFVCEKEEEVISEVEKVESCQEIVKPELAEIQLATLEYYRSQTRYYNLLSIDYENILRERGLIE